MISSGGRQQTPVSSKISILQKLAFICKKHVWFLCLEGLPARERLTTTIKDFQYNWLSHGLRKDSKN